MRQTLTQIYDEKAARGEIKADPAQRAVLPALESLRSYLESAPKRKKTGFLAGLFGGKAEPAPKGFYLWGGVGRGKSMVMDLFTEATDCPQKRRVHFHAFMQEIHHAMHEARKTGVEDALEPVAARIIDELRLLAFDEMQITDITDAMIVGRLFEKLFAGGVVVVTTSNRAPEELYKNGLNRNLFLPFIALLREKMEVHELVSEKDYRQHRLQGAQVYFQPADASARAQIDAIWRDLAGGSKGEPLVLTVNGRQIELAHFANGTARANFNELCAKPLGPADYLAIAENLRVLILEDIPQLSIAKANEAKRFVTLIDALYEAGVRFIASAATEPEQLYITGTGAFEFERTASRLREMQDKNWGKNE